MPIAVVYIAAAMLLIGAAPLPYGYYTLLRIVACAVFVWAAVITFQRAGKVLPWIYALAAIVFNPLVKIHLPKEAWIAVDVAAGGLLLATTKRLR